MSDSLGIPNHIGFILDGNRRWAKANGVSSNEGHRRGAEVFRDISEAGFNKGIKYITGYIFSTENWTRSEHEVNFLMQLISRIFTDYFEELHKNGIKIVVLGRRNGLRAKVLKAITNAEEVSRDNKKGTLALCINYSGQDEIVDAVKSIIAHKTTLEHINRDTLAKALYIPEIPPLDLIIRTSGEHRTSGFMLGRSDYAELYFTEKYWPDFHTQDLEQALIDYNNRLRRFGS